jgi:hypothetical protein
MKVQLVYGKRIKPMTPTYNNTNHDNDDDEDIGLPGCVVALVMVAAGIPAACAILILLAALLD